MKLKTLKDLAYIDIINSVPLSVKVINIDRVKKEAIKWYKKAKEDCGEDWDLDNELEGEMWFIEHFFNLTEEDLKNG
ncbi:MAG: hypothetical protein IH948_00250 [Bacteroidetes bacterium]|nr:hypothetical protein [Bacteroidota bacterium]